MLTDGLAILAVLCLIVVVSEWLVQKTFMRHIGTALLVILVTAVVANIGLLPAGSTAEQPVPVYNGIFAYVAPLTIFWLLLPVNLRDIIQAGVPMVVLFLIGSVGTLLGVIGGMVLIDGPEVIGPLFAALGGMFVGTYTGGSVNFNALALTYDMVREGTLYAGSVAVDNVITALWMMATIALPRLLSPLWGRYARPSATSLRPMPDVAGDVREDTEALHPMDLGLMLALGLGAVWLSEVLAEALASVGIGLPSIIILTALALLLAQIPAIGRMSGAKVLGLFTVYLFLAVIGAFCDLRALAELGRLGGSLFVFASFTVLLHGLITFGAGRLLKFDLDLTAVASQANVGGGTSALALARSLGRSDLVLPGILVGALGNALGTFLGFWAAESILPLLG